MAVLVDKTGVGRFDIWKKGLMNKWTERCEVGQLDGQADEITTEEVDG
jgi:hypothetical protein